MVIFEKQWHKVAFLVIMLYFSLIFTTILLPIMWIYYRIPTTDYYLISLAIMFLGGIVFNSVSFINFYNNREVLEDGFPKEIVLKIFGWLTVGLTVLFIIRVLLTGDMLTNLYFILLLMFGGYSWFWILEGYIQAKNNKDKKRRSEKNTPWLGRVLFISIAMSLLLGYLYGLR